MITAVLAVFIAQTITRPISEMKRQAREMARGNFAKKVKIYSNDEIGQLAETFNHLSKKLQEEQIKTESEKRKLSSILTYMTDGVVSTDRRGRVILINEAAESMLGVSRDSVISQPIISVSEISVRIRYFYLLSSRNDR